MNRAIPVVHNSSALEFYQVYYLQKVPYVTFQYEEDSCPPPPPQSSALLPPAVMRVCSVGLGHLVELDLLLEDIAFLHGSCHQFLRQFFIHVRAPVLIFPALCDHPFHGKEASPIVCKWHRHLNDKRMVVYFHFQNGFIWSFYVASGEFSIIYFFCIRGSVWGSDI